MALTAAVVLVLCAVALGVQSQDATAQAASNCKRIGRAVAYRDKSGQLLAYFRASQAWCWSGNDVTYVSKPGAFGVVTKLGASLGWRYVGVVGKKDDYFGYKDQGRHAGHISIRQGSFLVCAKNTPCYKKTPQLQFIVYYNGNGYSVGKA